MTDILQAIVRKINRLTKNTLVVLVVMTITGLLGGLLLLHSHAATPTASIEPESGIISSAASKVSDTAASGSQSVRFGSGVAASGNSCPPLPAFPDANCTGYPPGTILKHVPQDITSATQAGGDNVGWTWNASGGYIQVTSNDAVIDAVLVNGGVQDGSNPGMLLKNSHILGTGVGGNTPIVNVGDSGTVQDTEIGNGTTFQGGWGAYSGGANDLFLRVNIHNVLHGIHIDGGTTVRDSYIHDLVMGDNVNGSTTSHTDGIFVSTGSNMVFDHDHWYSAGNNSDIFVQDYGNTTEGVSNITVAHSLFEAGPIRSSSYGQTIYGVGIEDKAFHSRENTVSITHNVFSKGDWTIDPIEVPSDAITTDNTYQDGSTVTSSDIHISQFSY